MLLWPMVNFCLKVAQIGDLSSKIQWFEPFDLACIKTSNHWILDVKCSLMDLIADLLICNKNPRFYDFEPILDLFWLILGPNWAKRVDYSYQALTFIGLKPWDKFHQNRYARSRAWFYVVALNWEWPFWAKKWAKWQNLLGHVFLAQTYTLWPKMVGFHDFIGTANGPLWKNLAVKGAL